MLPVAVPTASCSVCCVPEFIAVGGASAWQLWPPADQVAAGAAQGRADTAVVQLGVPAVLSVPLLHE